jgi:hypothetical protein
MGVGIAPPFPRQPGYNADPADGILGQYDALANKADTQVVYNYAQELANLQPNNNAVRPKLQTLKGLAGNPVGEGQDLEYHKKLTRAFKAAVVEMRGPPGGRRRKTRKGRKGRRSTRRRGGNLFAPSRQAPRPDPEEPARTGSVAAVLEKKKNDAALEKLAGEDYDRANDRLRQDYKDAGNAMKARAAAMSKTAGRRRTTRSKKTRRR